MVLLSRPFLSSSSSPAPPAPTPAVPAGGRLPSAGLDALLEAYPSQPSWDGQPADAPKGSRVDPAAVQKAAKPMFWGWGVRDVWDAGWMVFGKVNHVALEILSHTVFGPRKKSWGIEMTIISSFLRDVGQHSALTDISFLRAIMSLSNFVPLPPSALVTPISFRVRYRGLRGILAEFDKHEKGGPLYEPSHDDLGQGRELGGEWVVDKDFFVAWQKEWREAKQATANGWTRKQSPSPHRSENEESSLPPPAVKPSGGAERICLYLHGGAYYLFSAASHRTITTQISRVCEARVFAINYRLAPETRFPGPLHDAVSAYLRLIQDLKIAPQNIFVAGDSAGGGLCLGLLMYLRDNNYPLPSGAILMSPWVDLTMSCNSWDSNAPFDIVPRPLPDDHLNPVLCFLGKDGMKHLTHPYASPLFGDFAGLPPLLIQYGEAEVLRDENTLLAHKAALAGVVVMPEVFEDAVHVFQTFPFLEATKVAFASQREFILSVVPNQRHAASSKVEPAMAEILSPQAKLFRGDGQEVSLNEELDWQETTAAVQAGENADVLSSSRPIGRTDTASSAATSVDPTPTPRNGEDVIALDTLASESALGLTLDPPTVDRGDGVAEEDSDVQQYFITMRPPPPPLSKVKVSSPTAARRATLSTAATSPASLSSSYAPPARTARPRAPTASSVASTPSAPTSPISNRCPSPLTRAFSSLSSKRASFPSFFHSTSPIKDAYSSLSPSSSSGTSGNISSSSRRPKLPSFTPSFDGSRRDEHAHIVHPPAPKVRGRSESHPEITELIRNFAAKANAADAQSQDGEGGYRIRRYKSNGMEAAGGS